MRMYVHATPTGDTSINRSSTTANTYIASRDQCYRQEAQWRPSSQPVARFSDAFAMSQKRCRLWRLGQRLSGATKSNLHFKSLQRERRLYDNGCHSDPIQLLLLKTHLSLWVSVDGRGAAKHSSCVPSFG